MLMYAISLKLQLPACVTIHNQCLNIKLLSSVYFSNAEICPKLSEQQIDIGTKMMTCFEINLTQDEFEGALLLKLQRYSNWYDMLLFKLQGYFNWYNMDTSTTETNKEKCTYMLVAWGRHHSIPSVDVTLIEHAKEFTWNEEKLKRLYDKNRDRFKKYEDTISSTWVMDDNIALKTIFGVNYLEENFELNITVSEEKDEYAISPFCIDLER
jgi:hypothetical protein